MKDLQNQYEKLLNIVVECGPAAVAFSGGADSSLLLKAFHDVFGELSLSYFANSVLQTPDDLDNALSTAAGIGANLRVVEISPLEWPEFTINPSDRCYHCKRKVYSHFKKILPATDMALVDGTNLDDLCEERPGHRAIDELGVLRPLVTAGFDKPMIRKLGRYLNIPSWNRDSASCLATRVPAGLEISLQRLKDIALHENILTQKGFAGCRVKFDAINSKVLNLEVKRKDIPIITNPQVWEKITKEFSELGISKLHLDLKGRA